MNNNHHSFNSAGQFLQDEDFIRWRLFQTEDTCYYWDRFQAENPQLKPQLLEAIRLFQTVRLGNRQLTADDKQAIHHLILQMVHRQKRRKIMFRTVSAAAILLIGIISLLFIRQMKVTDQSVTGVNAIMGETLPSEEIYLITGDKKTELAHNAHIGVTQEGKVVITDSNKQERQLSLADTELNRLVVPKGRRSNLTLSDGSRIWLNSGTQLDFPGEFRGKTREISVEGEIFIEVAPDNEVPFIVHAGDLNILVHGTSFNVSAYREDPFKSVVLVDGSVSVETANKLTAVLAPSEMIAISGNNLSKEVVNVSEYISWTKGVLEFNSTPMSEILKKIGRYYNIQFENSPDLELNRKTYSGKLFLSNNLDSVMTSVSILSSTSYQRKNQIIYIK